MSASTNNCNLLSKCKFPNPALESLLNPVAAESRKRDGRGGGGGVGKRLLHAGPLLHQQRRVQSAKGQRRREWALFRDALIPFMGRSSVTTDNPFLLYSEGVILVVVEGVFVGSKSHAFDVLTLRFRV